MIARMIGTTLISTCLTRTWRILQGRIMQAY